jgi:hypothetical protein
LLYNIPNTFNRVKIGALSRVLVIVYIVGVFKSMYKALFIYTVKRVAVFLQKLQSWVLVVYSLYIINIDRQEAIDIVLLGYIVAFDLDLDVVRLASILFFDIYLVFFCSFSLGTTARLRRVQRILFVIFFVIIELKF